LTDCQRRTAEADGNRPSASLRRSGRHRLRAELYAYFDAFYGLLLQLPAYREVVAYGSSHIGAASLPHAALQRLEDGLALLARAGFSETRAREAFSACYNWTRGMAVLRQEPQPPSGASVVAEVIALSDDHFHAGLRLLIGGIAASTRADNADPAELHIS
jgi:hypothetical protein